MTNNIVKVLQRSQLSHSQADVKHFIYIHSKWLEDVTELELLLTTSNNSYRAILKHDEIKSAAEELEQPYDEFFAECKNALITQMGLPGFDYELNEQQPCFKLYKCTGYETLYIDLPLRKVSNCYQMLDAAIESAQRAPAAQASWTGETSEQYNELRTEYDQYIKDTKLCEKKLLQKFVLLMNSKKERIEELERKLEQRNNVAANAGTHEEADKIEDDDDDDDDYGGETQVMSQGELMQERQRIAQNTK
ncbi:PREDICTED: uncharacterized protein LOC108612997 [Drosophila arizonae]|uniref:Uncharacterized protein LOC108612997 n=1 Tax=Drosophila arizonae TaxID=7263 RepID=A0ABM1P351_DROAR|nr:PREDICTED: uncharacterized protein LOC108612997 [Drosophila arizonae]